MPIYEFVCPSCSSTVEHLQRNFASADKGCPSCCGRPMVKKFPLANYKLAWFTPLRGKNHKDIGPPPAPRIPAEISRMANA